jgi:hypothetical protein
MRQSGMDGLTKGSTMLQHVCCLSSFGEGHAKAPRVEVLVLGRTKIELFGRLQPDERPFRGAATPLVADGTP